jgi:hypothetical protein
VTLLTAAAGTSTASAAENCKSGSRSSILVTRLSLRSGGLEELGDELLGAIAAQQIDHPDDLARQLAGGLGREQDVELPVVLSAQPLQGDGDVLAGQEGAGGRPRRRAAGCLIASSKSRKRPNTVTVSEGIRSCRAFSSVADLLSV